MCRGGRESGDSQFFAVSDGDDSKSPGIELAYHRFAGLVEFRRKDIVECIPVAFDVCFPKRLPES